MSPPAPPSRSDGSGTSEENDGIEATDGGEDDSDVEVVLALPEELREAFKEPFGPLYTDARALLDATEKGGALLAVGDVVTYHLLETGRRPDVAVLDGYTERTPVAEEIEAGTDAGAYDEHVEVRNPAATLTAGVLEALADALEGAGTTVIDVAGEEDLLALPAILAAPEGSSVVYGQPGEGMVRVPVEEGTRRRARELLEGMDGDHERAWNLLGIAAE